MYTCTCANASLTVSPAAAPGSRALRTHLYLRRSEEILVRPLRANLCSDDKLDGPQLQRIWRRIAGRRGCWFRYAGPDGFDHERRVRLYEPTGSMPGQKRCDGRRLARDDPRRIIQRQPSDGVNAGPVVGKVRERRWPNVACLRVIHVRNELEGICDSLNVLLWERRPIF